MNIEVITAPIADLDEELDRGLVSLTEAIDALEPDRVAHGMLGGSFGYGAQYENAVFMMHPFCWCEQEDCPWCSGCNCMPQAEHYVDGKRVANWYEATKGSIPSMPHEVAEHGTPEYERASEAFEVAIKRRNARMRIVFPEIIHKCGHQWAIDMPRREDFGPDQSAPNFWHKASGLKVWWYKWIGRDMKVWGTDGVDIAAVLRECTASLGQA